MKIVKNNILPPKRFSAINLFGITFARHSTRLDERMIHHETIHTQQMKYMLYFFFYLWYGIEWLIRCVQYRNPITAYFNISFEREAYANDRNFDYLNERKAYAWINYIVNKKS